MDKQFLIRCRAVIIHDDKMLVVKHKSDIDFYCFPGGHLEWGENIKHCLSREIIEELGVEPKIGRLLYVNNFIEQEKTQSIEFFFEITNGMDYLDSQNLTRSHAFEIVEIYWANKDEQIKILPRTLAEDFRKGEILSDQIRYID